MVTTAAAVGATAVAFFSLGSWVVLAVALALAAWDGVAAAALIASTVAVAVRLGSASLPGLAGAQAVLGPAVMTGPPLAASSAALCGAAVLLVAPAGLRGLPFGLAAALVVAGPAPADLTAAGVRFLAAAGCVELVFALDRLAPKLARWRPAAAGVAAVASVVLAVAARPAGAVWRWWDATDIGKGLATGAVVAGAAAVAIALARRQLAVDSQVTVE